MHAASQLTTFIRSNNIDSYESLIEALPTSLALTPWVNAGGQLIRSPELQKLIQQIKSGKIKDWKQVHQFYITQGENYAKDKLQHALAAFRQAHDFNIRKGGRSALKNILENAVTLKEWMTKDINTSSAKVNTNPFRQMV